MARTQTHPLLDHDQAWGQHHALQPLGQSGVVNSFARRPTRSGAVRTQALHARGKTRWPSVVGECPRPRLAAEIHPEEETQRRDEHPEQPAPEQQKKQTEQLLRNYENELKASQELLEKFSKFEEMLNNTKPQLSLRVFYDADGSEVNLLMVGN